MRKVKWYFVVALAIAGVLIIATGFLLVVPRIMMEEL